MECHFKSAAFSIPRYALLKDTLTDYVAIRTQIKNAHFERGKRFIPIEGNYAPIWYQTVQNVLATELFSFNQTARKVLFIPRNNTYRNSKRYNKIIIDVHSVFLFVLIL